MGCNSPCCSQKRSAETLTPPGAPPRRHASAQKRGHVFLTAIAPPIRSTLPGFVRAAGGFRQARRGADRSTPARQKACPDAPPASSVALAAHHTHLSETWPF